MAGAYLSGFCSDRGEPVAGVEDDRVALVASAVVEDFPAVGRVEPGCGASGDGAFDGLGSGVSRGVL